MDASTIQNLLTGFYNLSWQGLVMIAVGILLIYLAIKKGFENSPSSACWKDAVTCFPVS